MGAAQRWWRVTYPSPAKMMAPSQQIGTSMSAMDDVFGPRSQRPDHPDFWRISEIYLESDAAMDEAEGDQKDVVWHDRVSDVVDLNSAMYAAMNRTMLAFGNPMASEGGPAGKITLRQHAAVSALWVEAFMAGAMFQQRGGHQ